MKAQYPNKAAVYVTKYIPMYIQNDGLKEINKQKQLSETKETFYIVVDRPTTTKIADTLEQLDKKIQHGII